MVAAVSGLSPVIMTVRNPIFLSRAKRSFMAGFRTSSNTTIPTIFRSSHTARGVAPFEATLSTRFLRSPGMSPLLSVTNFTMASAAPFRMRRPSGRSTPLMRVCAVKAIDTASRGRGVGPCGWLTGTRSCCSNNFTMLFPSGVWSAADASAASRATSSTEWEPTGMNLVAWRLPMVIVPVLSRSTTSMSPANSTALPLLAIMLFCRARSIPAMPMAASNAPIVVGIRQTNSAINVGTSVPRLCNGSVIPK